MKECPLVPEILCERLEGVKWNGQGGRRKILQIVQNVLEIFMLGQCPSLGELIKKTGTLE